MELTTEPALQPPPPPPPPPPTNTNDGSQIEEWLSLTDYAAKYRISVSTLRRRIKSNQISHRFIDGKYLLLDSRPAELDHAYHQQERMDVTLDEVSAADFLRDLGRDMGESIAGPAVDHDAHAAELTKQVFAQTPLPQPAKAPESPPAPAAQAQAAAHSDHALLEELKHAYMRILQEKEEQIIRLKEEVTDLHTLVRVLEDDNNRMRGALGR